MNIFTTAAMKNHIPIAALSFSGIYRVLIILFSGLIFDQHTADEAAEIYLLFMLSTSLFGLPLVAVFMGKNSDENYSMFLLVVILSLCFVITCQGIYENIDPYGLFFCCLSSSLFEVVRQSVLNKKLYGSIVFCYLIAAAFFIFSWILYFNPYQYFIASFSIVTIYLLYSVVTSDGVVRISIGSLDTRAYFNFFISSAASTSIVYVVPLILIYFLNSESSFNIAVLSAVLSIFIFVPRLLLNDYYYELRSGAGVFSRFSYYRRKIDLYIFFSCLIISPAVIGCFHSGYIILMYSVAVLLSQSSLIYSVFFTVNEQAAVLRNINLCSFFFLFVSTLAMYFLLYIKMFDEHEFIMGFVVAFFVYQVVKITVSEHLFSKRNIVE